MKLSIIIPCYNEEERLPVLEKGLKEFINEWTDEYEIIVVDDGSKDNTSQIIIKNSFFRYLESNGLFKLVKLEANQGKGAALKAGVLNANGDYILTMDADISTHPLEVLEWKKNLNGLFYENNIVIASRTHGGSKLVEKKYRKIIGIVFNFFVRKITNINIKDSQCGFKLYPNTIAKSLFYNLNTKGWAHDVELLCRARQLNIKIVELPIKWVTQANSKVNVFKDSISMLIQIIKIRLLILKKPFLHYEIKKETQEKYQPE